ncbi:MAG: 2-C-methyl-D-erythritol 2,4-cyclodiphosphate synthase [Ignavibacteria bacterium]|nr:2-C-methyl-D-erythritol 2,4-cyclodiphosphate synthase [Ignavibacteria bacterium]
MSFGNLRVGFGYDIHKFSANRKLILGGVEIPYKYGLLGHSDADVLLHSICDALLGAAGLKDIGNQFPNTSKKYKNISSLILLEKTYSLLKKKKWKVVNVDSIIILEEPKIMRYISQMKKNISLRIDCKNISIKATTSEGLGFIGEKRGCSAYTIVLVVKQ